MKFTEINQLLNSSTRKGALNALSKESIQNSWLTTAQAYRLYGRETIERWLKEGLINLIPHLKRSKKILDRKQLETIAESSNRISYLPVAVR